jgi:hypothetical protein
VAYDVRPTQRLLKEDLRVIAGSGIDTDGAVRGPGLVRQCCQSSGEIGTAVVSDHNGSDVNILKN